MVTHGVIVLERKKCDQDAKTTTSVGRSMEIFHRARATAERVHARAPHRGRPVIDR